jgi:hypothetical protein
VHTHHGTPLLAGRAGGLVLVGLDAEALGVGEGVADDAGGAELVEGGVMSNVAVAVVVRAEGWEED